MPVPVRVIVFDGDCSLCNRWVQFVLDRDRRGSFCFASNGSAAGRKLLGNHGIDADHVQTVVLIEHEKAYVRSDAVLRIVRELTWPWPLLRFARLLPRPLRDWVYNRIAENRYRWFGREETCRVPEPRWQGRFLA